MIFPPNRRRGVTLVELLVVMSVLATLAALMVPMFGNTVQSTQLDATFQTMTAVRNAIVGCGSGPGYMQDMKGLTIAGNTDPDMLVGLPFSVGSLFTNPGAQGYDPTFRRGWRGPYLTQLVDGGGALLDSYSTRNGKPGSALVLQWPPVGTPNRAYRVRLVSLGADGKLDPGYQSIWDPAALTTSTIKDDVILYLRPEPGSGGTPYTNYYDLKNKLQTR